MEDDEAPAKTGVEQSLAACEFNSRRPPQSE